MKMATFFFQENKLGIMGNHDDDDDEHGHSYDLGNNSSSDSDSDLLNGSDSNSDSDSDLFEEVNSSSSSFGSSATPSRSKDALHDMSSLLEELPIKRGLSKHYNGKSQSFTSLSNVRSLEDLAKPEHPYNKKLKTCKSYQQFEENNNNNNNESDHHHLHLLQLAAAGRRRRRSSCSSKIIKKASLGRGGSFSSLCTKRNGSFDRPPLIPPLPPHKSDNSRNNSFNTRSPLFALGV